MNTTNISTSVQYTTVFNNPNYLFWFLFVTICSIPSFFCSLFDFYHCFKCRKTLIYNNINHHIILVLLVNDFAQMVICQPLVLEYFYLGHIKYLNSYTFCMLWILVNYVLINQSLFFTMHASIERYLLLFHKQVMFKYKIFTHYIPLLITCIYLPCMLFYLIFLYPCEQSFDYAAYECGIPCYVKSQPIGLINEIIHIFFPVVMIVIFDVLILVRVIELKKRTLSSSSSNNLWKQNSRMIIQLTAICVLTSLAWIPYVAGILIQIFKEPTFGSSKIFFHFAQGTYVPCLGTPFLVLIALPKDVREKVFTCFTYLRRTKLNYSNGKKNDLTTVTVNRSY